MPRNHRAPLLSFITLLYIAICPAAKCDELQDALNSLNTAIENSASYDAQQEQEIAALRAEKSRLSNPADIYETNRQLFNKYESYICDSALYYLNENIDLANRMGDEGKRIESVLLKCSVLSKGGLFLEAINLQSTINPASLPGNIKALYYHNLFDLYQYLSEYAHGTEYEPRYTNLRSAYRDSTMMASSPDSFFYESLYPAKLVGDGEAESAIKYINEKINKYRSGTREYSILASLMAFAYQALGDKDNEMLYLARSAKSDIEGSVKENMSIRSLAERMYANDMIDNANRYIKQSIADAAFFSSRLRNNQAAQNLSLIDRAYDDAQRHYNSTLRTFNIIMGALALVLVLSIIFIIRQMRKVSQSNRKLQKATEELNQLNAELNSINAQAESANRQLVEANNIKDLSLRYFMELCSTSINNLERFRASLYNKLVTGKNDELRRILNSTQMINESQKELYATFDNAFLSIFPTFVEEFNKLFKEEDRFELKSGERLNTELRIYALIRMGITDSQKIADFLSCSLSTVYTYRSRVRNRSLHTTDIDQKVMGIGSIKS